MRIEITERANGTKREKIFIEGESLTKQSESKACDINNIMKKYKTFDNIPDELKRKVQYGDFSTASDYMEAVKTVQKAEETFEILNSSLKNKFQNDPAKFLEYVNDPNNNEEMYKLLHLVFDINKFQV